MTAKVEQWMKDAIEEIVVELPMLEDAPTEQARRRLTKIIAAHYPEQQVAPSLPLPSGHNYTALAILKLAEDKLKEQAEPVRELVAAARENVIIGFHPTQEARNRLRTALSVFPSSPEQKGGE